MRDRFVVFGKRRREHMATVATGHEIQRIAGRRMDSGLQRGAAWHRDWGRRKTRARVGVVGSVEIQIALVDGAVVAAAQAVDHGWVSLQLHASLQSAHENSRDAWTFVCQGSLFLD